MSVTDIGRQLSNNFMLRILNDSVADTQRRISSGLKSTTVAGLGVSGASNSIVFRNKNDVIDAYSANLNTAKAKFSVMDSALGGIADEARNTLTNLRKQLQAAAPEATIIRNEAQTQLKAVLEKLNVQVGGQYLFGGDALYTAPFANATTLNTNAASSATTLIGTGGLTTAQVVTAARTSSGTALGYSAGLPAAGNLSFRADDATDIDYTIKADQSGFADVIRGLSLIANLPAPTNAAQQASYWSIVNGAITLLDEGTKAIDDIQGSLGIKAAQVDALLAEHSETQSKFEEYIGTIEDADMAEASMQLQNLQTQLQASYSVIAQLKDLSLINFL